MIIAREGLAVFFVGTGNEHAVPISYGFGQSKTLVCPGSELFGRKLRQGRARELIAERRGLVAHAGESFTTLHQVIPKVVEVNRRTLFSGADPEFCTPGIAVGKISAKQRRGMEWLMHVSGEMKDP